MSTHEELLAAVKLLRERTGDPNAWQQGLAPAEVAAVTSPATGPHELDAILAKIRRQHPTVFDAAAPGAPETAPDGANGEAAEAIAQAEAVLAHQNSASAQLDMQVVSAILNAHLKTVEGKDALTRLQRETEAAVRTRSDLDTPAGARDFQRFLIGKLRDIRGIVMDASLDDTSKSALMAAWTSLYGASTGGPEPAPAAAPARGAADEPDPAWDPLLDPLLAEDPSALAADPPGPGPGTGPLPAEGVVAPAAPTAPTLPNIPASGAAPLPGLGTSPGSLGDWGLPSREGREGGPDPGLLDPDEAVMLEPDPDPDPDDERDDDASPEHDDQHAADPPPAGQAGPTVVTLPDGETVTAASPELAAAIKTAVAGTPIAEAFGQQGIVIPPPGTAVANPIDPLDVAPGDIGMLTDRHALALGPTKALLDGQIQHIATVSGAGFLGWEHPPAASARATAPAGPDAPTPTRPATTSTTRQ